ncbi:MAG: Panacea domain-containing protein [Candidatus Taylorbacteria bacterium]|nr:Panacea domain-containing protein [Candidatus Taylorbacteria bacterium]
MKIDFEKIGLIASYLAQNTEKPYVTKLFKLFYYIDFVAYATRGASVTSDIYYKLPYGPVPTVIKNEIDLLSMEMILGENCKPQLSKYIALAPDKDKFGKLVLSKSDKDIDLNKKLSLFEANLITVVAKQFRKSGAKELSEQTHKEKPWLLSSVNGPIDYALAKELDIRKIIPAYAGK